MFKGQGHGYSLTGCKVFTLRGGYMNIPNRSPECSVKRVHNFDYIYWLFVEFYVLRKSRRWYLEQRLYYLVNYFI